MKSTTNSPGNKNPEMVLYSLQQHAYKI